MIENQEEKKEFRKWFEKEIKNPSHNKAPDIIKIYRIAWLAFQRGIEKGKRIKPENWKKRQSS